MYTTSFNKFKKVEIVLVFSDYNDMKLKIIYKKRAEKNHKYMDIKQHVTEQLLDQRKQDIKSYIDTNEAKSIRYKNLGESSKAVLWGKFIALQAYLEK